MDAILTDWRGQVRLLSGGTLLLELVLGCIVLLGVQHLRSHEALEVAQSALVRADEREQAARAAQILGLRFNSALNNMLQGLLMFDHAGDLLVVNHCFERMFNLPVGAATPGMTYQELAERIVECGQIGADEMQAIRRATSGVGKRRCASDHRVATTRWPNSQCDPSASWRKDGLRPMRMSPNVGKPRQEWRI